MSRLKLGSAPNFLKGNLNSLISAILLLLAGMAMTGCTPLIMQAVERGDINTVKQLLDKGADVNDDYRGYYTVLMLAIRDGHTEIAKLLIEKGADVNARNKEGWTALTSAAYSGHTEMAKLLIEKGADIDMALIGLESGVINFPEDGRMKAGIKFLEKFAKKQEIASQPAMSLLKPSQEVSPAIKSDVDELPLIKAKPNKNAFAIVIGIESYRQKLPKADYAVHDAQTMTEYLTKVMGYPEENVVTLLNEHATNVDFAKYFEKWLPNNIEKDSSVFIYYSGHGAPNTKTGDAFLVPYDGDPSFIAETGYSLTRLYEQLGKLEAKEIVVALDSCFSGAGGRSVLAKGARPLVMNMNNSVIPSKVAVLSAASGEQISSTYDEKGHGLFTYFMLKGLKGEAETNGSVEIGNLFEYIKPQVERIARKSYNNEQTPQLIAPKELIRMKLR